MTEKQNFEVSTWAEAEVTPGPGRDVGPEQDQTQDDEQADEPETDQEPK